jgi:hypothetical protein
MAQAKHHSSTIQTIADALNVGDVGAVLSAIGVPAAGARGAGEVSSSNLIPDSRPTAGQGVKNEREPSGASPIPSSGTGVNRRSLMNLAISSAALAATPAVAFGRSEDDSSLLAIEEEIFRELELAHANDDGINRFEGIWRDELKRLTAERNAGKSNLTDAEIWERVKQMPDSREHTRLVELAEPHHNRVEKLIGQMWAIRARTSEGRRAKVQVLLCCVLDWNWCGPDKETEWDVRLARDLMFEMVGGEPGEELRDQFRPARAA